MVYIDFNFQGLEKNRKLQRSCFQTSEKFGSILPMFGKSQHAATQFKDPEPSGCFQ